MFILHSINDSDSEYVYVLVLASYEIRCVHSITYSDSG